MTARVKVLLDRRVNCLHFVGYESGGRLNVCLKSKSEPARRHIPQLPRPHLLRFGTAAAGYGKQEQNYAEE